MTEATIKESIKEAKKYIKAADKVLDRLKEDEYIFISGCRETGTLKRRSMDLSNILVKIRRGN